MHPQLCGSPSAHDERARRFARSPRFENDAVLDRMATRLAKQPEVRRETVEHPFGTVKQWTNQGARAAPHPGAWVLVLSPVGSCQLALQPDRNTLG
jgi:hypothetical protein